MKRVVPLSESDVLFPVTHYGKEIMMLSLESAAIRNQNINMSRTHRKFTPTFLVRKDVRRRQAHGRSAHAQMQFVHDERALGISSLTRFAIHFFIQFCTHPKGSHMVQHYEERSLECVQLLPTPAFDIS